MSKTDALPPAHGHYRRDIDGLRAVAILPVVLYHFKVPGFGGGFIGVDVFFVISGYLITQVLTDAGRPISLATFYARRIRRLLPALMIMVLATITAALVLMPQRSFLAFGDSLIWLAGAGSNVYFWRSLAGYFAALGDGRPLLHTWSLAVEEQFYFVFPIALALIGRFKANWRWPAVALAFTLSFALAAWMAPKAPSASFYLLPMRAWELLAGALLALRPTAPPRAYRWATLEGFLGLALIGYAVVTFSSASQVPGLAAAIPCLGAILLIHAGEAAPANAASRLLSIGPLVGVGLISYALYLWHWPINVFLNRFILIAPSDGLIKAAAILASLAMAYLSWKLVEQPARRGALLGTTPRAFIAAGLSAAVVAGAGALIVKAHGLPQRFPDFAAVTAERAQPATLAEPSAAAPPTTVEGFQPSGWLYRKPGGASSVMVWGDSFANHLISGFGQLEPEMPFSVYQHTAPACPPVIDFHPKSNPTCHDFNVRALAVIKAQGIDTVIMSARWDSYLLTGKLKTAPIGETVRTLEGMGVRVLFVGQSPIYNFDYPDEFYYRQRKAGAAGEDAWASNNSTPAVNAELKFLVGSAFFDPIPVFCNGQLCLYRTEGHFLVHDMGHLSAAGSRRMVAALMQAPQLRAAGSSGR